MSFASSEYFRRPHRHAHHLIRNSNVGLMSGFLLGFGLANVAQHTYHDLTPHWLHVVVFEILFSLFFGFAMKEVWENVFPGDHENGEKDGVFYSKNTRYLVLALTLGGIFGPTTLFFIGYFIGIDVPKEAFVVVTATDIAISAAMAKIIFRSTDHPAVQLLLGLAIADDLAGMLMIAGLFGEGLLRIEVLYGILLVLFAMSLTYFVMRGMLKLRWYGWYAIPGAISMFGLHEAGFHMALAFVFIVPCMPHRKRDPLIFHEMEAYHSLGREFRDTLNRAEHDLQPVITVTLFLFAFMASGVSIGGAGSLSLFIAFCLVVGKPLGVFVASIIARQIPNLWPEDVSIHMSNTVGMLSGAGFTVSLFVSELAFEGSQYEAAAIGAVLSTGAVFGAFVYAWLTGVIREVAENAAKTVKNDRTHSAHAIMPGT